MPAAKKDDLKSRFEAAAAAAKQTRKKPDNSTLLKLYSYYKQATEGDAKGEDEGGPEGHRCDPAGPDPGWPNPDLCLSGSPGRLPAPGQHILGLGPATRCGPK